MLGLLLTTTLALAGQLADTEEVRTPRLSPEERAPLETELMRLHATRPRFLAPILFVSLGAAGAAGGLTLLNLGSALVFSKPALVATFLLSGGAVLLLAGVAFAIVGIIQIQRRLTQKQAVDVEIDQVEKRLDALDRLGPVSTVLATF